MAKAVRRQHSMVWLQGLTCGAVVTLAPGVAVLLGLLLGPGLLALLLDREPGTPDGALRAADGAGHLRAAAARAVVGWAAA